jgi:hypothetical protein
MHPVVIMDDGLAVSYTMPVSYIMQAGAIS